MLRGVTLNSDEAAVGTGMKRASSGSVSKSWLWKCLLVAALLLIPGSLLLWPVVVMALRRIRADRTRADRTRAERASVEYLQAAPSA